MARNLLLIANGYPALTEQFAEVFRLEGYEATIAADSREAQRLLRTGLQPDLIILDLHREGSDASKFNSLWTKRERHIPIVLITSEDDAPTHAARLGASAYIEEPYDLHRLLVTVERILNWTAPLPRRDHLRFRRAGTRLDRAA
jgi:DNA-binding NtrC family response regulator